MENFIYNTPTKVYFGTGNYQNVGKIIASYGIKRVLLHYGTGSIKANGLYDSVVKSLNEEGIYYKELGGVTPNPKLSLVKKGVEIVKNEKLELILAVGGGSVIDSSKLISHGALVDFDPWLFSIKEREVVNHLPVATILTIAASGSDMSNSCVITNDTTWEKRGFASEANRPLFSILDPTLTYTVSKYQTACGIVDIMMHTLERYFSLGDVTLVTDNIALGLLKSVMSSGRIAYDNPTNYAARADLLWANSLSHNTLTGLGRNFVMSVHQLEHSLSGMYDSIAHGAGLAALWPSWARYSYKATPERFLRFSYEVMEITPTNDKESDILAGIAKLEAFFKEIGMPTTLRELNVEEAKLKDLANNTMFNGKRVLKDIVTIDYNAALEIYKMAF